MHLDSVAKPKAKFGYWYDFGDDWMHEIRIEREFESETGKRDARCLSGERACPPKDRGGVPGHENVLAILADPAHEEHGEMREWIDDDFDPHRFDLALADRQLSRLKL